MIDPNDSAHPTIETEMYYDNVSDQHYPRVFSSGGLTKRERFAMAALQGMLADHTCDAEPDEFAEIAVNYADALIAELNKEKRT